MNPFGYNPKVILVTFFPTYLSKQMLPTERGKPTSPEPHLLMEKTLRSLLCTSISMLSSGKMHPKMIFTSIKTKQGRVLLLMTSITNSIYFHNPVSI